jgi:3-oxoacid CoA-transferase subunit B
MAWTNDQMCMIAAKEFLAFKGGCYANLGIGMPTKVVRHISKDVDVQLHSENGMLGMGDFPSTEEDVNPNLINAGKQTITEFPHSCYFDSSISFGMIRGGHLDITILGALQVSQDGDLANWAIPGKSIKGMGGAMDLVAGTKRVVVLMSHLAKDGGLKLVKKCSLPLTGVKVINKVITDMGSFELKDGKVILVEKPDDVTIDEIKKLTEPEIVVQLT